MGGSTAQEEAICRSSALYACITGDEIYERYYFRNRKDAKNGLYSDHMIFSPCVPVFRDDV